MTARFSLSMDIHRVLFSHQPSKSGHVDHFEKRGLAWKHPECGGSGGTDQVPGFAFIHVFLRDGREGQIHQELKTASLASFLSNGFIGGKVHTFIIMSLEKSHG